MAALSFKPFDKGTQRKPDGLLARFISISVNCINYPVFCFQSYLLGWIFDSTRSYPLSFVVASMFSATGCCLLFFIPPPRSPQKRPSEEAMNLRHRLNHLEQKKSNSVSVIGAAVWNWRKTDYEQAPIVLSCRAVALEYLLGVNSWGAREGPYLAAYTFCGVCGRARRVDRPHARILFCRTESFRALPNTASGFLLWKQGVVHSNLTLLHDLRVFRFFSLKELKDWKPISCDKLEGQWRPREGRNTFSSLSPIPVRSLFSRILWLIYGKPYCQKVF